jgi:hypothetical protein
MEVWFALIKARELGRLTEFMTSKSDPVNSVTAVLPHVRLSLRERVG